MTKEDIEAAKRAAFAAKPHIEVNAKKLRKKDYRDEIDTIIKAGEEDYQDFSDDELSQVLKVWIVDTIQDFLCKLGMKPCMKLQKKIIFSLKYVIVRSTKIIKANT